MRCLTASCEPFQKRVTERFGDGCIFPPNIVSFLGKASVGNTISEFQVWMHFRWTAIQPSLRWTDARPSRLMWTGLYPSENMSRTSSGRVCRVSSPPDQFWWLPYICVTGHRREDCTIYKVNFSQSVKNIVCKGISGTPSSEAQNGARTIRR